MSHIPKSDVASEIAIDAARSRPLFIVAPSGRCGSNLLANMLVESGPFRFPSEDRLIGEDYLLRNSELLRAYADRTSFEWRKWVADEKDLDRRKRLLLESIGDGLLGFFSEQSSNAERLIVKTPDSTNIDLFPQLFPRSQMLILIRDGRDVVESSHTAWPHHSRQEWALWWAEGARRIIQFTRGAGEGFENKLWKLVRYEDLLSADSLKKTGVLEFLGVEEFRWDRLEDLPVYGSSFLCLDEKGKFDWDVKPKPQGFAFAQRWAHWAKELKQDFKQSAGKELIELGYACDDSW